MPQWRDDTTYLHEAALTHGLDTTLVLNRVLLTGPAENPDTLCFAKGYPPSTSQAAVALTSEQDLARQFLFEEGVSVPRWTTLRFNAPAATQQKAAGELGYPLVLRAAWTGTRSRSVAMSIAVPGEDAFPPAVAELRAAAGKRASRPNKPFGRFMMEAPVAGQEFRALVVGDDVLAVASLPSMADKRISPIDIPISTVHPDIHTLLVDAAKAIPDLGLACVQLIVADATASLGHDGCVVTGLKASPHLPFFERARPGAGPALAARILESQAAPAGVALTEPQSKIAVRLRAGAVPATESAREDLKKLVDDGAVEQLYVNHDDDGLYVDLPAASPAQIAAICDGMLSNKNRQIRPLYIETRRVSELAQSV